MNLPLNSVEKLIARTKKFIETSPWLIDLPIMLASMCDDALNGIPLHQHPMISEIYQLAVAILLNGKGGIVVTEKARKQIVLIRIFFSVFEKNVQNSKKYSALRNNLDHCTEAWTKKHHNMYSVSGFLDIKIASGKLVDKFDYSEWIQRRMYAKIREKMNDHINAIPQEHCCGVCLEECDKECFITCKKCKNSTCTGCYQDFVKHLLGDGDCELKCMSCNNHFKDTDWFFSFWQDKSFRGEYELVKLRSDLKALGKVIECNYCQYPYHYDDNELQQQGYILDCSNCKYHTCFQCLPLVCLPPNYLEEEKDHEHSNSEVYWKNYISSKVNELVFAQCPECSQFGIKESGCNVVKCNRCRIYFCNTCGFNLGPDGAC